MRRKLIIASIMLLGVGSITGCAGVYRSEISRTATGAIVVSKSPSQVSYKDPDGTEIAVDSRTPSIAREAIGAITTAATAKILTDD